MSGDYGDSAAPAQSEAELRKLREEQERARKINAERDEQERLKRLGIGKTTTVQAPAATPAGGAAPTDSQPVGQVNAQVDGDPDLQKPVPGAGQKGAMGREIPKDAGVGAPNKIAWNAVAESVKLQTSGKTYDYAWGGSKPETSFDCSGYTGWVYDKAGLSLPGVAQEQDFAVPEGKERIGVRKVSKDPKRQLLKVKKEESLPGDLLIWKGGSAGGHVGIILVKGGAFFQESADPNQISPYREKNADATFIGIFRPTALADGKPVIAEAAVSSGTPSTPAASTSSKPAGRRRRDDEE